MVREQEYDDDNAASEPVNASVPACKMLTEDFLLPNLIETPSPEGMYLPRLPSSIA